MNSLTLRGAHRLQARRHRLRSNHPRHDVSSPGARRLSPTIICELSSNRLTKEDTATINPFEHRIARVGLSVHQKLPAFRDLTYSTLNRSIAKSLGQDDARINQSQIIATLAGIGGDIVPHQDGCVGFTDPPSALTFWYALENATLENGCLCVAKGSHLTTPLRQRLIRIDDGLPRFVDLDTALWVNGAVRGTIPEGYEHEALEVRKGTLIHLCGNLMHRSASNRSEMNRMAYTFSVVDGGARCPEDNYVQLAAGDGGRL